MGKGAWCHRPHARRVVRELPHPDQLQHLPSHRSGNREPRDCHTTEGRCEDAARRLARRDVGAGKGSASGRFRLAAWRGSRQWNAAVHTVPRGEDVRIVSRRHGLAGLPQAELRGTACRRGVLGKRHLPVVPQHRNILPGVSPTVGHRVVAQHEFRVPYRAADVDSLARAGGTNRHGIVCVLPSAERLHSLSLRGGRLARESAWPRLSGRAIGAAKRGQLSLVPLHQRSTRRMTKACCLHFLIEGRS